LTVRNAVILECGLVMFGKSASTFHSNLQKNESLTLKMKIAFSYDGLVPCIWTQLHGVTRQI